MALRKLIGQQLPEPPTGAGGSIVEQILAGQVAQVDLQYTRSKAALQTS